MTTAFRLSLLASLVLFAVLGGGVESNSFAGSDSPVSDDWVMVSPRSITKENLSPPWIILFNQYRATLGADPSIEVVLTTFGWR